MKKVTTLIVFVTCLLLGRIGYTQVSEPVEWIDVPLADNVYFEDRPVYQADRVEIPVPANSDLEYMLDMKQGHSVSYQWRSTDISNPELLLAEFHGHTVRDSEEPGNVMFFKQGRGDTSDGYLVAPFDGVHGWYFSNETDSDISITLSLSGFYTIPDPELALVLGANRRVGQPAPERLAVHAQCSSFTGRS